MNGKIMKQDPIVRERLMEQRKPTIIKSMHSPRYYCGIGITQSENYVFVLWHKQKRQATNRVTYGIGNTPTQALLSYRQRTGYISRFEALRLLNLAKKNREEKK